MRAGGKGVKKKKRKESDYTIGLVYTNGLLRCRFK